MPDSDLPYPAWCGLLAVVRRFADGDDGTDAAADALRALRAAAGLPPRGPSTPAVVEAACFACFPADMPRRKRLARVLALTEDVLHGRPLPPLPPVPGAFTEHVPAALAAVRDLSADVAEAARRREHERAARLEGLRRDAEALRALAEQDAWDDEHGRPSRRRAVV